MVIIAPFRQHLAHVATHARALLCSSGVGFSRVVQGKIVVIYNIYKHDLGLRHPILSSSVGKHFLAKVYPVLPTVAEDAEEYPHRYRGL